MKKNVLLVLIAALAVLQAHAGTPTEKKKIQFGDGIYSRDSTWKFGGYAGVTLSQVALYQWGPGGTNNFAFLITGNAYANFKKNRLLWENSLDIKWGMVANGMVRKTVLAKRNFQKNIDILALKSIFGYAITPKLYASVKLGFESQFSPSYDYTLTDTVNGNYRKYTVSKFAAPAVLTIGPGLTYKPVDYFTLFFSPVEGKMTFVQKDHPGRDTTTLPDGSLTDNYYRDVDETRFGLKRGDMFMGELGAELDLLFQKDIVKNINWKSHLNVFASYLNASYNTDLPYYYSAADSMGTRSIAASTKHIPVVKWDNDIVFKVTKFLTATLSTRFVYQYNAQVSLDTRDNGTGKKGADGVTDMDKNGVPVLGFNKLQIFEQFGLSLSYKF